MDQLQLLARFHLLVVEVVVQVDQLLQMVQMVVKVAELVIMDQVLLALETLHQ